MSPQKAFSTPQHRTSGVEEVRTRVSLARALVSVTCLEAQLKPSIPRKASFTTRGQAQIRSLWGTLSQAQLFAEHL